MLERSPRISLPGHQGAEGAVSEHAITFADFKGFIKSYLWTILVPVALFAALGGLYVWTAPVLYTAVAKVLIDPPRGQFFEQDLGVGAAPDSAMIESRVEVARSDRVLRSVVRQLQLADDPVFNGSKPRGIRALIANVLGSADQENLDPADEREQNALDELDSNLNVVRQGPTRVLLISFVADDPNRAAEVANTVASNFVQDQLTNQSEAALRGSEWLQERTQELRQKLENAARAAQEFKTKSNIVEMGSRGSLDDQRLEEINTQLTSARAQTSEARARLDRINSVLSSGVPDAALADSLNSQIITGLRQRFLTAAARESELSSRVGPEHLARSNLRNEMKELQRAMRDELRRIADTYKSDYEVAQSREASLLARLNELIGSTGLTRQAQLQLRELESQAQSYRTIYESFLQKYTEAVQQQSFPITEARVIGPAFPPRSNSHPKTKLVFTFSIMLGSIFGVALAVVRNNMDRSLKLPEQVKKLGLECIGTVPRLETSSRKSLLKEVVRSPLSRFSEDVREIKTSISIANLVRPTTCIGILSLLPNEGKTTLACNLANLFGMSGLRTLLIDADLRKRTLTRSLAPNAGSGLIEVLSGFQTLNQSTWSEMDSKFDFLPTVLSQPIPNSSDLLTSVAMQRLLDEVRETYDFVLLDLPPLGALVDGRAVAPSLDGVIIVSEWGRTPIEGLAEAMQGLNIAQARVLGLVINKVDVQSVRAYREEAKGYYFN
jgi:succinoglycan biosynthesis transport protein ExoP